MKASSGRHPLFLSTPIEGVLDASRSSRPPRSSPVSSSPASGVAKVGHSVWSLRPFSPAGLGFACYAVLAYSTDALPAPSLCSFRIAGGVIGRG